LKLLVVASALDLRAPLGVTPSMWQLLKALAEQNVELVVTPYFGAAIESPWWTVAENPTQLEGDIAARLKDLVPSRLRRGQRTDGEGASDRLTRVLVERVTKPRWQRHLARIVEAHGDFDAVLFACVPPNHFSGVPALLERKFRVPSYFWDGDVPASLPRFAGFRTGFRIYEGADLGEFVAVLSNSKGGVDELRQMGARDVEVFYYAVDPELFAPMQVNQDIDVFFYGLGREYREEWVDAMLDGPSRDLPELRFAARGSRLGAMPSVRLLPYASFSKLKSYCCRSRVNLLITRHAHASVYGSSTARPFELAALGCAIVSNPYLGIEEWFEPGREILIVHNREEAVGAYRALAADPSLRNELGQRARVRLLAEHTYARRAQQLISLVQRTAQSLTPSAPVGL
jgi:spore maturation protein CgeB